MGVGAVLVVFDAPAVGGFCERVRVDEDFQRLETGSFATGEDMLFEEDFSVAHFADLDRCVSSGAQDAMDFLQGGGEKSFPIGQ